MSFALPNRPALATAICLGIVAGAPTGVHAQDAARVLTRTLDRGPGEALAIDVGAAGVWQRLQKLRTTASVLYTTGHPDDEEPGVLTLLGRGMGARTALLTLNRGEGGANAVGPELFDALGLIRSEELRLAGRYYGLDDQYFTTAVDYGYSKTLDEAFRSWDREALIEDMVRVIRINRPLVVISRWHGSERDGHGHHQAAGVLTPLAVEAAADPSRFPRQITEEGLRPWRVRKLYRGRLTGDEPAHVLAEQQRQSPWLGTSFAEFGSYGLSLQRSQTDGRVRGGPGAPARYERLVPTGSQSETDLFDGLDTSLAGVAALLRTPDREVAALLTAAQAEIERAVTAFTPEDPSRVVPHLVSARDGLSRARAAVDAATDAAFVLGVELRELDTALAAALGLELRAVATPAGEGPGATMGPVIAGQTVDVHTSLTVRGNVEVELASVRLSAPPGWTAPPAMSGRRLAGGTSTNATTRLRIPTDAEPSRPWFYRPSIAQNRYSVRDSASIHLGESQPTVHAIAVLDVSGTRLRLSEPVRTLESLAPYGTVRRMLTVAPVVSVRALPGAAIVRPGNRTVSVAVEVVSNARSPVAAVVDLELPAGWTAAPRAREVTFSGPGETFSARFEVTPAGTGNGTSRLLARARVDGRTYTEGYQRIVHRDLAPTYLYADAAVDVVRVDAVTAPDLLIGYVMGVGDDVPSAIEQLGASVRLLTEDDLSGGDLTDYDAVVVGTRAYAVRPDLAASNGRLLEYARGGGNLVVLYQTPEYTPETQAPFAASLPGNAEEVSEEDAPVTILAPGHALLTTPNSITAADFDGWIEQRGSKFFATWAPEYTALIETHDTGQDPQEGVWLTAPVGSGHFTYASIALHRQLPYGVPGAYRMLANLISLGR